MPRPGIAVQFGRQSHAHAIALPQVLNLRRGQRLDRPALQARVRLLASAGTVLSAVPGAMPAAMLMLSGGERGRRAQQQRRT